MSKITTLALSTLGISKDARAAVKPGEYKVNTLVRINGTVTVGNDTATHQVNTIPWMQMCDILLAKLNDETIESVIRQVESDDYTVGDFKERAEKAMETLHGSTRKTRKGAVKGDLTVAEVK